MATTYQFISEILRTHFWQMETGMFQHYKNILLSGRGQFGPIEWDRKPVQPFGMLFQSGKEGFEEKLYISDAKAYDSNSWMIKHEDDQIIHVTPVSGPVTHGGGECSYGTRDMADALIFADAHPKVIGHLVILDTPGGSATADDLNEAISQAKKPVHALIRGMNASKGVEISSHIPHVWAEHADKMIGSVGAMADFDGIPSGTIVDGRKYFTVYADKSNDKNGWYEAAIEKNDLEPVKAELNRLNEKFHANVKARWPGVTDEYLTGKMYPAGEVIGKLVDGIASFKEVVLKIFEEAGVERNQKGEITPLGLIASAANSKTKEPEECLLPQTVAEEAKKEEQTPPAPTSAIEQENKNIHPLNPKTKMKLNELQALLGEETTAEVNSEGDVEITPELHERIVAKALENASATKAAEEEARKSKETISEQQKQLQELALSTVPLSKGAAGTDQGTEGTGEITGSILDGITNPLECIKKTKEFAEQIGII